jgi:hypothetical protein
MSLYENKIKFYRTILFEDFSFVLVKFRWEQIPHNIDFLDKKDIKNYSSSS